MRIFNSIREHQQINEECLKEEAAPANVSGDIAGTTGDPPGPSKFSMLRRKKKKKDECEVNESGEYGDLLRNTIIDKGKKLGDWAGKSFFLHKGILWLVGSHAVVNKGPIEKAKKTLNKGLLKALKLESLELDEGLGRGSSSRKPRTPKMEVEKEFDKIKDDFGFSLNYAKKHLEKKFKIKNVRFLKDRQTGIDHVLDFREALTGPTRMEVAKEFDKIKTTVSKLGLAKTHLEKKFNISKVRFHTVRGEVSLLDFKVNESLDEKWKKDVEIDSTGEHADKTVEQIKREIEDLRGEPGNNEELGELLFALRAKGGWKKGEGAAGLKTEAQMRSIPISPDRRKDIEGGKLEVIHSIPSAESSPTYAPGSHFQVLRLRSSIVYRKRDPFVMATVSNPKKKPIKVLGYYGSHPTSNGALKFAKNGELIESVELDERRKDVFVIVDKKGKVVVAELTKQNADKEISRHRGGTIVLDPDAKVGDVLKTFAKESVELDEGKKPRYQKGDKVTWKGKKGIIIRYDDKGPYESPFYVVSFKGQYESEKIPQHRLEESVELDEGGMKDLHDLINQGKSAEEIAKIMRIDVKAIKVLMKGYKKESIELDEADNTAAVAKQVKGAVKKYVSGTPTVRSKGGKTRFIMVSGEKIDNELRKKVLDVVAPNAKVHDKDNISYGNITGRIISASVDQWVEALGLTESVELDEKQKSIFDIDPKSKEWKKAKHFKTGETIEIHPFDGARYVMKTDKGGMEFIRKSSVKLKEEVIDEAATKAEPNTRFNCKSFYVDSTTYTNFSKGRRKFSRWSNYVDTSEGIGAEIYAYVKKHPTRPIVIEDGKGNCRVIKFNRMGGGGNRRRRITTAINQELE